MKERENETAAEKQRQKAAKNAAKVTQLSQTSKRKASQAPTQKKRRQKRVVELVGGPDEEYTPQYPQLLLLAAAAMSTFQLNLDNTSLSHIYKDHYPMISIIFTGCGWLYTLVFNRVEF